MTVWLTLVGLPVPPAAKLKLAVFEALFVGVGATIGLSQVTVAVLMPAAALGADV